MFYVCQDVMAMTYVSAAHASESCQVSFFTTFVMTTKKPVMTFVMTPNTFEELEVELKRASTWKCVVTYSGFTDKNQAEAHDTCICLCMDRCVLLKKPIHENSGFLVAQLMPRHWDLVGDGTRDFQRVTALLSIHRGQANSFQVS